MHHISVARLQILMIPDFAITEYKVKGATFQMVILDLYRNTKLENQSSYKRFCSNYVQLLRLQTLDKI